MGALGLDPFSDIVNVHWASKLYLEVEISGSNQRGGKAGPNPIDNTARPSITITITNESVKLLETDLQNFDNDVHSCMQYEPVQEGFIGFGPMYDAGGYGWSDPIFGTVGDDAQTAYDKWARHEFSAVTHVTAPNADGQCSTAIVPYEVADEEAWTSTGTLRHETWYVNLVTVGVNYGSTHGIDYKYLYELSPGDDLISIEIDGLIPPSDEPPYQDGGASIYVSVYSRLRQIPTLSYLDDDPPTPDDTCRITVNYKSEELFKFSVHQDTDPDHKQIDNYGQTFQPYKVTAIPSDNAIDVIPDQPPAQFP